MCRNIFVLQQNLTNITMSREADLDFARSDKGIFTFIWISIRDPLGNIQTITVLKSLKSLCLTKRQADGQADCQTHCVSVCAGL